MLIYPYYTAQRAAGCHRYRQRYNTLLSVVNTTSQYKVVKFASSKARPAEKFSTSTCSCLRKTCGPAQLFPD